ncbi:phage virion morphogenesis protein [Pseudoalteromonas sp. SG45-1]|uniref:phage virion morphogenesis protein n=1 Tax=Pseudoalteromonas sp. SG45-1 TaxID=2760957 RepID=UPI0016019A98|nr:phage virion morphogenesis protein [Pseudoalteromonas sp. SG45-1]MBB1403133.1 phage virion morphogenesis protein [Pseudoalteromonas sp. SG45-1]
MLNVKFDEGRSKDQLAFLQLKPNKRRNILRRVIRTTNKSSKERITKQTDLAGKTWQGRANGKKKKMLTKLKKFMKVRHSANDASVYFSGGNSGKIARAHQEGISLDAGKPKGKAAQNKEGPATRNLARALIAEGYKIPRRKGKGSKRPSIKWITENLSINQAGFLLRDLKGSSSKSTWQIDLPARSFLGQTQGEEKQQMNFILNQAMHVA